MAIPQRVKRETKTKAYDYKARHGANPHDIPMGANDVPTVNAVVAFQFHGDEIMTFEVDGEPYVAMRRIVENLGMAWGRQQTKLMEQETKFNCTLMCTVGADGKRRDMLSIPLAKLPLWLASINPNKVPDLQARAKIELYQERSAVALYEFWFKGSVVSAGGDVDARLSAMETQLARLTGMSKMTVHKVTGIQQDVALSTRLDETVNLLVERKFAELQMAIVPDLTAGEVIEMAGLTDMKGLRRLSRWVSDRLRIVHAEKGVAVRRAKLGRSRAYVFDERTCRDWLLDGGKEAILMRAQEMRGQGVLRLVVAKQDQQK